MASTEKIFLLYLYFKKTRQIEAFQRFLQIEILEEKQTKERFQEKRTAKAKNQRGSRDCIGKSRIRISKNKFWTSEDVQRKADERQAEVATTNKKKNRDFGSRKKIKKQRGCHESRKERTHIVL